MNELYEKNIKVYLEIIDRFWEFDSESRKFIEERLKSDWKFAPEFQKIFDSVENEGDQRIRWNIDTSDPEVSQIFKTSDEGWEIFKRSFNHARRILAEKYDCEIGYTEYCNNKAVFNKNPTKLKKILETVYKENPQYAQAEMNTNNEAEIEAKIIKIFERIGTVKKPTRKLQVVLSLNPVDWLLSSTSSQISSCLNLENGSGGHKFFAGLPFLCGDPNRAMIYICDGNKKQYRGIEVDDPITRTFAVLNKKGRIGIIKWYANEYLNVASLKKITGLDLISHLNDDAKYPLKMLFLKNGLMASIFNDDGGWEYDKELQTIRYINKGKGGFQVFHKSGVETTSLANLNFEKPYLLREITNYKLTTMEDTGVSFNNMAQQFICPKCKEMKPITINNRSSNGRRKVICMDCFSTSLFTCTYCNNVYDLDDKSYEGLVQTKSGLKHAKLCSSCHGSLKRRVCECCGHMIHENAAHNTVEGSYVCDSCIGTPSKGYKVCNSCGAYSRKSIKSVYDRYEKTIRSYCKHHLPNLKNEIESIRKDNLFDSERHYLAPCVECPTCHNITSTNGRPCVLCLETHGIPEMEI